MAPAFTSPLTFPTTGFKEIDASTPIEEEKLPTYQPEHYYPATLGQVLQDRYQIVGKVGYGGSSTVWLSRDLAKRQHVVLKICVNHSNKANNELDIYKYLESVYPMAEGFLARDLHRKLYDSFELEGPHGPHICLVHQPLGLSLMQILDLIPSQTLRIESIKGSLRQIIASLDFLHQARIVHTDLQARNLLIDIDSPEVFTTFENAELQTPVPRKVLEDRTIYMSRRIPLTEKFPLITDFGEAHIFGENEKFPWEDVMPDVYRAPEIVLRMPWDTKIDIWSVGMVCWDLVSSTTLFNARNNERLLDDSIHIAEMIAIMGPPPKIFLEQSKMGRIWWDEQGKWKGPAPIPTHSLEELADKIKGEDKEGFLRFLRRILKWLPEERPKANEILYDPWLMKGLGK
ncbi:hypothetical protein LOZ12_005618 [Ophidiomyces ophidiicola]|uniref:Uncharacterized protein n=1 Tax=Ophidiomyces ophidiicola TaxID=1387563 RepID=A0ACB8V2I1_9EURO|nr:hypothetical protein LOZ64_001731 [Ophidiomyces ophidiicola]KAI1935060.1 hypothetical protein LOZ62_006101 [Ophidiomyces ophidiicola]KAI1966476.1 hypothetical protein LOZ56_005685 [Ophidiomyces ophidiicola]KAI1999043.1 hypothetical protein LOZ50_006637 [Ophidiomyces ophidiicola]KAI2005433.1 hypothetical protein LOZ49_005418 [Ophidiomyces ophidiicola]